jgi:hypothetical protein
MVKGAICFFAFWVLLFGCTSRVTSPSPVSSAPAVVVPDVPSIRLEQEPVEKPEAIPEPEISESQDGKKEEKKEEKKDEQESSDSAGKDSKEEIALLEPPPPEPPRIEAPKESPILPDLTITNVFLDGKKRLAVTIANIGDGPLPMRFGSLKIFVDGQLKKSYGLNDLTNQSFLEPKKDVTIRTSLTIRGRREIQASVETSDEIEESKKDNNDFEKALEGLPVGPGIVIKGLDLTEDFELSIILSNEGEVDLQRGVTFRVRVFVNGLKTSEFDHFTSEVIKGNFGNRYTMDPPYRVVISGTSEVRVSVSPRLFSNESGSGRTILKRTFIIFPLSMAAQEKQEFKFSFSSPPLKDDSPPEKVKVETRWEGGGSSLMVSISGPEHGKNRPILSGKSPLKIEFPIRYEETQPERPWRVYIMNTADKKVEGHLVIQHP